MRVLGISAFYHDAAAALWIAIGFLQRRRKNGLHRKHDANFPKHAIEYCLEEGGLALMISIILPSMTNLS